MSRRDRPDRFPLLGIGAAALAVVCCAGPPLLAGALAGVGIALVAGVGAVAVLCALAVGLGALRTRRRSRECDDGTERLAR